MVEMVESGFDERVLSAVRRGDRSRSRLARPARSVDPRRPRGARVCRREPSAAADRAVLGGVGGGPVRAGQLPTRRSTQLNALIARQPGALVLADAATAPRIDGDSVVVFDDWLASCRPTCPPSIRRRRRRRRDRAVHERHHVRAEGGVAAPPPPDGVPARLRRVRRRRRGRGGARDRAAVPRRRRRQHAVEPLRRPPARVPARLRAARCGSTPSRREGVTNAMVVPTMLARIVDALDGADRRRADVALAVATAAPRCPSGCSREALRLFPDTGFVNAYGLTETASTIAVLGPDDHRAAVESDDPAVRPPVVVGRAGSLPTVEIEIRDELDQPVAAGRDRHDLRARRADLGRVRDRQPARRRRLVLHPRPRLGRRATATCSSRAAPTTRSSAAARTSRRPRSRRCCSPTMRVAEACVVGVPDDEWGQRIVAAVVLRDGEDASTPTSCGTPSASSCAVEDARTRSCSGTDLPHTDDREDCCGGSCCRSSPIRPDHRRVAAVDEADRSAIVGSCTTVSRRSPPTIRTSEGIVMS